jgi:uncharacterized damage-inducible protein DinB
MLDRTDPPLRGDEVTTLLAFLAFHRATLRARMAGVDAAGLATTVAASTLTLGGLLKHATLVEDHWFSVMLRGREPAAPWDAVDWEGDPDWEFRTGATDPLADLLTAYDATLEASDAHIEAALAEGGLDTLSARPSRREGQGLFSLRWILLHMIEEHARHNGHADLLREAVDGTVGE